MLENQVPLQAGPARGNDWAGSYTSLTDDSLVTRARDGNRDAFGELARRYRAAAVRTAASIVGSDKAEDVVQDALLLAFRALGMLQDPGRFPQWFGTITRYRALRFGRNESRRTARLVALDGTRVEPPVQAHQGSEGEDSDIARLETALLRLPDAFGRVLRLHFLEGLPHQRIAERLGVSLSTSKWRCYRGKQLLRELLRGGDGAAARVEERCERCRAGNDGIGCEEESGEAASARRSSRPRGPSVEGGRHQPHGLPRSPTSFVASTPHG